MRSLTLQEVQLGLDDLLGKRTEALQSCASGQLYRPLLVAKRDAIAALPGELVRGQPLAEQLAAADERHDAFGSATFLMMEAYRRLENHLPELSRQAGEVQNDYVSELADLRASYSEQAASAKQRREKLPAAASQLEAFPVAGGGTLLDWVRTYLDAGVELDTLLSERADARSTQDRAGATTLRTSTIGLLGRLRAAIADELEVNPALPRDLDARLFGYFDELQRMHGATSSSSSQPKAPTDPNAPAQ